MKALSTSSLPTPGSRRKPRFYRTASGCRFTFSTCIATELHLITTVEAALIWRTAYLSRLGTTAPGVTCGSVWQRWSETSKTGGLSAMTEEKKKPVKRKSKDRSMLQEILKLMELMDKECRPIHTWQFLRQRSGQPDPSMFNRMLRELREHLDE